MIIENFDQAVVDFTSAVAIKQSLLPEHHRERAEAHYKLALAYEYSEQIEQAIDQVHLSLNVLQKRLETLQHSDEGKGKETANISSEDTEKEVKEIQALFPEMEDKVFDVDSARGTD